MFYLTHENERGTRHIHRATQFIRADMTALGFHAGIICQSRDKETSGNWSEQCEVFLMSDTFNAMGERPTFFAFFIDAKGRIHADLDRIAAAIEKHNAAIAD